MCGTADLWIDQNADFNQPITLSSGGTPVNLTGWRFRLVAQTAAQTVNGQTVPGTNVITLDSSLNNGSIQIPTPTNGQIILYIPAATTATYTSWTQANYDLIYEDASGDTRRLLKGLINLSPGISSFS